jgi:hypothetical protein
VEAGICVARQPSQGMWQLLHPTLASVCAGADILQAGD